MGSESETVSMRGFLLPLVLQLLHTFSAERTFSPTSGSKPSWPGLEITDPVDIGRPGRPLEDLEDLFDRFRLHDDIGRPGKPNDDTVACSDCSDLEDASSTTGISVLSTDGIGKSSPSSCPTPSFCKRPSLKNQKKMICCLRLRVGRRGRLMCPHSCD